jgi:hypothetical protein
MILDIACSQCLFAVDTETGRRRLAEHHMILKFSSRRRKMRRMEGRNSNRRVDANQCGRKLDATGLFLEFSSGRDGGILTLSHLALRNRPCALILVQPEWSAGMNQQDLKPVTGLPVHQNSSTRSQAFSPLADITAKEPGRGKVVPHGCAASRTASMINAQSPSVLWARGRDGTSGPRRGFDYGPILDDACRNPGRLPSRDRSKRRAYVYCAFRA